MTTATIVDLRRTDLRTNVLENPYWITSGEMTLACDDKGALFFSFPITASIAPGYGSSFVLVHELVLQVATVFAGGTIAFTMGNYSLATDAVTTAGVCTEIDPNMYWEATDGAADTIAEAFHVPTTASAFLTDKAAGIYTTDNSFIPADSTVLCIVGILTSNAPITQGSAYLHALISVVPAV